MLYRLNIFQAAMTQTGALELAGDDEPQNVVDGAFRIATSAAGLVIGFSLLLLLMVALTTAI